ncbi:MAG: YlbF family regulator [Clostridiales bacterium]|nr:YlbF family regulator [Clostridiales bacterium]
MNETLPEEMLSLIHALGALVKADPRCAEIEKTIDAYERAEDLNALVSEYNEQQNFLASAYNRPEPLSEEFRQSVQDRIDALYDEITAHPAYVAYVEAKNAFDELTNAIYGELQFAITGQRPCAHDCASCASKCH